MTPEQIISVIEMYERRLVAAGVPRTRMDPRRAFRFTTIAERLAHAHYLCAGVKKYVQDPEKQRKTGSHLTAVQMCLSFAGWYTLEELIQHNTRTDPEKKTRKASKQAGPSDVLKEPVRLLNTSVWTMNVFAAHNIVVIGDVTKLTEPQLTSMLVSHENVDEVVAVLAQLGLKLAD